MCIVIFDRKSTAKHWCCYHATPWCSSREWNWDPRWRCVATLLNSNFERDNAHSSSKFSRISWTIPRKLKVNGSFWTPFGVRNPGKKYSWRKVSYFYDAWTQKLRFVRCHEICSNGLFLVRPSSGLLCSRCLVSSRNALCPTLRVLWGTECVAWWNRTLLRRRLAVFLNY